MTKENRNIKWYYLSTHLSIYLASYLYIHTLCIHDLGIWNVRSIPIVKKYFVLLEYFLIHNLITIMKEITIHLGIHRMRRKCFFFFFILLYIYLVVSVFCTFHMWEIQRWLLLLPFHTMKRKVGSGPQSNTTAQRLYSAQLSGGRKQTIKVVTTLITTACFL